MPIYIIDGRVPAVNPAAWIAPTATVVGDVAIGERCGLWFGAVLRGDTAGIVIGERTNVQDNAVGHADPGQPLTIGTDCTIGHGAIVHGCTIGDRVLVGMGATVMNGVTIGDESVIGANALIPEGKVFPPRSLIVGAPAKAVRVLDDVAVAGIRMSAASYVEKAALYARSLTISQPTDASG